MGMEIGSHTVAHARTFNTMPIGTGDEQYPYYKPRVLAADRTDSATVLGELGVSKFLLETAIGKTIVSFRPGYLRNPTSLPQALVASQYKYSSSFTADNALTHLPLHLNWDRQPTEETDIFDFPVTIEDEEPPSLMERLPQALYIANRLAEYGGLYVVLLHTNVVSPKIDFEHALLDSLRDRSWFGTVSEFGSFWAGRAGTSVDVSLNGKEREVTLLLSSATQGLPVQPPSRWRLVRVEPTSVSTVQVPAGVVVSSPADTVRLYFAVP